MISEISSKSDGDLAVVVWSHSMIMPSLSYIFIYILRYIVGIRSKKRKSKSKVLFVEFKFGGGFMRKIRCQLS